MNIDRVTSYHVGKWKCQILTGRADGRPGSQAYSSSVSVRDAARFRTKRLNDGDTLQGYKDGEQDAVITMRAPIGVDEKSVDLYWIVRRQFKVSEGDEECPDRECYTSSRTKRVDADDGSFALAASNTNNVDEVLEIELEFEELLQEDIDAPLYLIKEFRRSGDGRGRRRFEMYKVGSAPPDGDEGNVDEGCVINGDFYEVDDVFEDDDLCVEVECVAPGQVEIKEARRC